MKPVIAYYRASKTEQLNSIEVQRNQMRDFIKKYGDNYKLVAEYSEYHTGKDRKRIELAKAIKHCSEDNCTLAFTKIDRLSRLAEYSGQTEPLNPGQTEPVIPVKLSHSFRSN